MKLAKILMVMVVATGVVVAGGCKKKQNAGQSFAPLQVEGVSVDLPKLLNVLESSTNTEVQASVRNVQMNFRYRMYEKALMEIDKVANSPDLTEEQKKVAAEVLEQVKQVAAKAPSQ